MENLNRFIDHTLLKQDATEEQISQLCREAIKYQFKSVCVNPSRVAQSYQILKDTDVLVCTVIGFPLGAATTNVKCVEAKEAVDNGAREVDMVINVGAVKDGDWEYVQRDITQVVNTVKERAIVKAILETCLLTGDEIEKVCRICLAAGVHFVKTSTGFSTGGATVVTVALMRRTVGMNIGVKASGGIRDKKTTLEMIAAGASRVGTSAGVAIMESRE